MLPALLLACAPLQDARAFVADGAPVAVRERGGTWAREKGWLTARGVGRRLVGEAGGGSGDVRVRARLALEGLGGTAASVVLGSSHLGLDGRGGRIFVEGPLFGGPTRLLGPTPVREGEPFELGLARTGGVLVVTIDGEELVREPAEGALGELALRPWRARMRVSDFRASGDLAPLPPEPTLPDDAAVVWRSGEDGYHTYRIPSVVRAPDGALLAFCEGRRNGRSDTGDIDLLQKRSDDGGRTWGPATVVWDDGPNVCGNPCAVVDARTGDVHLLLTHNLGRDAEHEIVAGTSDGTRTVWHARSGDSGRTWTAPRDITATAKEPDWTWYATGPGVGIRLTRGPYVGRLVVPCDHIEAGTGAYRSHVIVSDDHGATWRIAGVARSDSVNECQVAERPGGGLLLNMRNYDRAKRARAVAVSWDGGERFGPVAWDESLPEPICQASLLAVRGPEGRAWLAFSNPADAERRVRMTVRASADGEGWPTERVLHEGPAAYSCLVQVDARTLGCLYEAGAYHPYEAIVFHRLPLAELAP